jgi:hypothetical protein
MPKNFNGPKKVELAKTKNKLDRRHVVILQNGHI